MKRDGKSYKERSTSGSRTGEEADGIVMKSGMATGTGREGAGRGGRMREVERSNFLTRRLVAA